jgi:trimeric autotransporter adhesin
VTFKDGSNTINTAAINAEGDAEFTTGGFGLGTHSVTASYPGDASYNSSNASAVNFTVVKGSVTVTVAPSLSPIAQGQTLVLSALVDGASTGGAAPTGTVQFANGTTLLGKATLSPTTDASTGAVAGIGPLTLSNLSLPAGSETITATYSGDTNYNAAAGSASLTVNGASGLLASSVSGNASASTTSPTAGITVSATVTGQNGHPAPTGKIDFQSSGQDLGQIAITPSTSGDTSTVSLTVNSGILLQGTNAITLQYSGDTTYQASSTTLSINNPLSDFSMVAVSPALSVASGSSTTDTLNFTSVNGFNNSVALTCTAPSAITCSLNPTSLTVNGTTSATLTVKAASATSELRPESRPAWLWASGGATLACVFLLGLPKHRRKWQSLLGLLVIAVLTAGFGCGGGSSSSSSGSTSSSGGSSSGSSTSGNTAAGTYTVLVSAAQGSTITHNLSITVRVQ